ncbi:MAG TPA: DUF3099 domain-containing protein [Microlunatus sp.]|nr:DUF3099 domain-containing protein [Microlunatus sp.]
MTGRSGQSAAHSAFPVTVITDAHPGASEEMWRRQKRYMITMGFRTACFVCMLFVPGVWRWVLLAGAVLLPYVAVVFANQANRKGRTDGFVELGEPEGRLQLTASDERIIPGEQDLRGEVGEEDESSGDGGRRVA